MTGAAADHVTEAKLQQWCQQHLPNAAVPVSFHLLQQMPRGPAGKLSRAALRPPTWAQTQPPDAQGAMNVCKATPYGEYKHTKKKGKVKKWTTPLLQWRHSKGAGGIKTVLHKL